MRSEEGRVSPLPSLLPPFYAPESEELEGQGLCFLAKIGYLHRKFCWPCQGQQSRQNALIMLHKVVIINSKVHSLVELPLAESRSVQVVGGK